MAVQKTDTDNDSNNLLSVIAKAASSKEVDIEKFERLLAMKKEIDAISAEKEFNGAFAQMQQELPTIVKNAEIAIRGQVQSKYAKLEHINQVVKPILGKYGFAVSFRPRVADGKQIVTAVLMHKGGHRESTDCELPFDTSGSKNHVQAVGSSISYGKRYALCSILNITIAEEDNDAASIGRPSYVTQMQAKRLHQLLGNDAGRVDKFCNYFEVPAIEMLPHDQYNRAESMIAAANRKK